MTSTGPASCHLANISARGEDRIRPGDDDAAHGIVGAGLARLRRQVAYALSRLSALRTCGLFIFNTTMSLEGRSTITWSLRVHDNQSVNIIH